MKTNRIILIVLVLLAAAAIYVYQNNDRTTLQEDLSNFAFADTASVTKIFLADRSGREILLERDSEMGWKLNETFGARKDLVNVLLRTIAKVEMKSPIAKSAHNTIVKQMSGRATKCEIYTENGLQKVYYVGNSAQDNHGTYMLIEGSSVPYITHLPGLNGYLTPRYTTLEAEWRSTKICNFHLEDIRSVAINYYNQPENSFKVTRHGKDEYSVKLLTPETPISNIDPVEVRRYLLNFRNLNFESFEVREGYKPDSIFAQPQLLAIEIEPVNGNNITIETWRLPALEGATNMDGNPIKWDIDRMHARLNGSNDLIFIQYFAFDRVLTYPDIFEVDPLLRRDN